MNDDVYGWLHQLSPEIFVLEHEDGAWLDIQFANAEVARQAAELAGGAVVVAAASTAPLVAAAVSLPAEVAQLRETKKPPLAGDPTTWGLAELDPDKAASFLRRFHE